MSRLRSIAPLVVLAAVPLALYAPILVPGGPVLYWGVYLLQFAPWRQLAVDQLRAGLWPLWNPYLGAGAPLAANLQTAAFYPPNALFLLMPVERAFGWELALHVALACLNAYVLGRVLRLGRFGALIAGLAYGMGGYVTAHWVFPSMVYAAAWLPLMVALTERLAAGPWHRGIASSRLGLTALFALVTGLQLLAGHAQTSFYSLLIAGAWAAFRAASHKPQDASLDSLGRERRITLYASLFTHYVLRLLPVALAVGWAVALAAVQLAPAAELAASSQRAAGLDQGFAYELSFWPWRLITLAAPDFFGNPLRGEYWAYGTYWEEAAFAGVLALILAGMAVGRRRAARPAEAPPVEAGAAGPGQPARGAVPFFAVLAGLSVLLALGNHTPIYPLLFRTAPGVSLFQAPARLMIGYALGVAMLAGIGAEIAAPPVRLTARHQRRLGLLLLAGLGAALAGVVARVAVPALPGSFGPAVARLGVTVALCIGLLLARRSRLGTGQWQALAAGLLAADLLVFGRGLAPATSPAVYHEPVAAAGLLSAQPPGRVALAYPAARDVYDRYVSLRSFGPTDPTYLAGLRESLYPNLNALDGLPGLANYDPLVVGPIHDLLDQASGTRDVQPAAAQARRVWDLAGVRYVIARGGEPGVEGLSTLGKRAGDGLSIYVNSTALPAAWLVPRARVIEDSGARLAALLDPAFDPRAEVLLGRAPAGGLPPAAAGRRSVPNEVRQGTEGGPEPSVLRPDANRVIIRVAAARPGYLVLSDTYYPGWRASVDGQPAEILPADHAFRAVYVPSGEHTVTFEYRPPSFRLGLIISGLALGLVVLAGPISRVPGRAGEREPSALNSKTEING